jgi:hypothetical protein
MANSPDQFAYGPIPATNVFKMTPGNAAPGLIVWLFLTTSPDFLDALDGVKGSNPDLVNATDISEKTNPTEACVNQIFDHYRNSPNRPRIGRS